MLVLKSRFFFVFENFPKIVSKSGAFSSQAEGINSNNPSIPSTIFDAFFILHSRPSISQPAFQHFAWFDRVPDLDLAQAFKEYLPAIQKDQDLLSYYRTLQRFAALHITGKQQHSVP